LQKTTDNFNEFEIAFLKGNYDICYFLLYEYKNEQNKENLDNKENKDENINDENNIENDINTKSEKKEKKKNNKLQKENKVLNDHPYQKYFLSKDFDLDYCKSLQEQNLFPLFNMELLYQSLLDRVPPKKCPSFAAERKRTKELMNKVPDPNETWGHFFKRLVNFELYNPPLIDKRNVSQMNSMYMNAQMKLMESEYGIKMSYYDDNDGGNMDESKQQGESEDQPILKLKKNKKIKKIDNEEEEEPENIIKINVKSVSKNANNTGNNGSNSVRDKDDFYSVDVNNTSGRQMNENEKSEEIPVNK
jgi:hypothetical protein